MKQNVIGFKLGLAIIAVFLVVLLSLGILIERMFTGFYYREMEKETEELAQHFTIMAQTGGHSAEQMMLSFAEFSDVSIFNITADGSAMLHSGRHNAEDRGFIRKNDLAKIFAGERVNFLYAAPDGYRYFVSGQPVAAANTPVDSALYVMSSTASMEHSLNGVRHILLYSGLGAFLLALGFTWFMARILSRPLIQMQQATRKLAAGELNTRLTITSKDEIGSLAAAINDLAVELQRYRDTRQEFLANISHELRTPITYLQGYAKVLKDGLYETEEERSLYLGVIDDEAHRIQHMVDDLFELSKMEEGQTVLYPEWLDFARLVEGTVHKIELSVKNKHLQLEARIGNEPLPLFGDRKRVEQIVLNLLENAVRYTDEGSIQVKVAKKENGALLIVEDTGIGIPEEELPYVFERFYRVEKSRSRQYGGTGLGLSIVGKLVELHGGTIAITSKPGAGTRCEVAFVNPVQD
ncbi:cell wall metabolism sensor histidine kinase WalK [Paenibacillus sp. NFR01]|uniref:sensor histidine kinase n=1 Tax=Paenibacillus sp. NFR01 TaxID=1566279 RepID=UPI0008BD6454|nr:HAMP domain-containing sensor histidine kinase [Paenibacillus sp. NFR01]SET18731.1 Signal transduction histidine kinase [Paenibacillus sp. NFR01]